MYTNTTNLPLSIAVFLATDTYDHNDDPNTISATTLLKPLRQLILASRIPKENRHVDIVGLINNRMGSAIHAGLEHAWLTNHKQAMLSLGYPKKFVEMTEINPTNPDPNKVAIYVETRHERKLGKWTISGKSDLIIDGGLEDLKTTSTFSATKGNNDEDYILQGSIYRWLKPDIITKEDIKIQWLFTDWSKQRALSDPTYPQSRILTKSFPLKSLAETEVFIKRKLDAIDKYWDAPEEEIPECTDDELWRSSPVYKYYKNPDKSSRATKNFDTESEARMRWHEDGRVGTVKHVPGQVKACKFCPAFDACSQKDTLIASGELELT